MTTQISKRAVTAGIGAGLGAGALALLAQTQRASADTPFSSFAFRATGLPAARTMPDRLVETKNVKDYNAKGDGSTDDTAAIQAAIGNQSPPYSSANRGTIFFPAGTYKISAPLTFELADGVFSISFVGAPGAKIQGNFPDALLKRSVNSPNGGIYHIDGLRLENNHPTGKGIMFHSVVGGSIRNCSISAFIGIETYNSQSVTIQDCSLSSGGVSGSSIGILAGNATSVISCDVTGFATGLQHSNLGLIIHGGRFEVNTVGILLGMGPTGDNFNSSAFDIAGVSMESNTTGIYLYNATCGRISGSPTAAQSGIAYGYRLRNVADTIIEGAAFASGQNWSGAAMSLEGPLARVTFYSINATDGSNASSWRIGTGLESFSMTNCNVELTVAQLPVGAVVGTVLPVKDATATTVGSTVAGGGSNRVSVVRSAGVWRII